MNYPKFEKRIRERIVDPAMQQAAQPAFGTVMHYDKRTNTATIVLSMPGSDHLGQFYTNVPCPTTRGLQMAAPEEGRGCWVIFKDNTLANPMITHFANPDFEGIDYHKQYEAKNDIPRFMMEM